MSETLESTISIFVKPTENIARKIMEIKRQVNTYYPDHEESSPHVSIYSCKFDEEKYSQLLEVLSHIDIPAFTAVIGPLVFKEMPKRNYTFVSLNFANAEAFVDLHKKVLAIANPLRGGLVRQKDINRHVNGEMSKEGWRATQEYGFQYFMERYLPHMTIGVTTIGDEGKATVLKGKLEQFENQTFPVAEFYIKLSRRSIPDETKIFESELTSIALRRDSAVVLG